MPRPDASARGSRRGAPVLVRRIRRWNLGRIRGALWALSALRVLRRELPRRGLEARPPEPPKLPPSAGGGVLTVVNRLSPTCLERSLLLQAWLLSQGRPHDVLIGGAKRDDEFTAHAWVEDFDSEASYAGFEVIRRFRAQ